MPCCPLDVKIVHIMTCTGWRRATTKGLLVTALKLFA